MTEYLNTEEYRQKRKEVIKSGIKAAFWMGSAFVLGYAAMALVGFGVLGVGAFVPELLSGISATTAFVGGAVCGVASIGSLVKAMYTTTDAQAQDDDLRARISAERMKETMQSMGLSKDNPAALAASTAYAMEEQASQVERLRQQQANANMLGAALRSR